MNISEYITHFFDKQTIVLVSTIDERGNIYSSVKGIVGIEPAGKMFIIDLYKGKTLKNLQSNPKITITAIDERHFIGYTIQGYANVVPREDIVGGIVSEWKDKVNARILKRLIQNVHTGRRSSKQFEAALPESPEYLIEICVENIIDISPPKNKDKK